MRHLRYADRLNSDSKGGSGLVILSFGFKGFTELTTTGNLTIIYLPLHVFGLRPNFKKAKKQIDGLGQVCLLVSGDPWMGALLAILVRKLFFSMAPIQMQIHADLGNSEWIKSSFKTRAKALVAHITLQKADNLRCVSTGQAAKIASMYAIEKTKITVIPVPTYDGRDATKIDLDRPRPHSVGFVGRIQEDRGTDLFIKIIEKLNSTKLDFKVVIAGSGPASMEFISRLSSILDKSQVVYCGEVPSHEMAEIWDQIGVLISCPPSESYGRALREAVANGVPIWITPTTGGLEFAQNLNPNYYRVLDLTLKPKELFTQYEDLSKAKISMSSIKDIRESNDVNLRGLINCWLQIALIGTD
jgi:glycosyltransferase involved in cell wall biosynthesis